MKRCLIILFSFLYIPSIYGQEKAIHFYSYLENIIKYKLHDNDSLVLDQYSDECSSCSWVISIFDKKDSCIVNFRPSIYGDGYSDLKYSYMELKDSLIASIEAEKVFLKGKSFKPKYSARLIVTYKNKARYFRLVYLAGLLYRFRFVKSTINLNE